MWLASFMAIVFLGLVINQVLGFNKLGSTVNVRSKFEGDRSYPKETKLLTAYKMSFHSVDV